MAAVKTGISALDAYLEFLDTSSGNEESLETPRIDAVLHQYKKRSDMAKKPVNPQSTSEVPSKDEYGERLRLMETQLASILQRSKAAVDNRTSTSSRIQGTRREPENSGTVSERHQEPFHRSRKEGQQRRRMKIRADKKDSSSEASGPDISTVAEDRQTKQTLSSHKSHKENFSSVQSVVQDLDSERERRWKAEQAVVKLADHVRLLQCQVEEWRKKHEIAIVRITQLDSSHSSLASELQRVSKDRDDLQAKLSQSQGEVESASSRCQELEDSIQSLQGTLKRNEQERTQEITNTMTRLREAEVKTTITEKEIEMERLVAQRLRQQLQDLQELLAVREKSHQRELEQHRPSSPQKIGLLIDREVERERGRSEDMMLQYRERLEQQQKAYKDLEEEFRAALRIEAARYQYLEQTLHEAQEEATQSNKETAQAREEQKKAAGLLAELTAIVREQKGRLTELIRAKQEMTDQFRHQVSQLEVDASARHRIEARMNSLQQENDQLSARVAAQESVIGGLREERRLWGQELALQGASLAQDRGRLEAKIESLSLEVESLREQLQNDKNTIRVREKVIEDQTQTIKQLKRELVSNGNQRRTRESEWQQIEEALRAEVEEEQVASRDLLDQLEAATELRVATEEQLQASEDQTDAWKDKYRKLRGQWEERVSVIAALEESVQQVQRQMEQQESQLLAEREQQTRDMTQQLAALQTSTQQQLATRETEVREELRADMINKDREVAQANQKVMSVEAEMRDLLTETSKEKRTMETKFKRLSQAFQDLQQELT